MLSLSKYLLVSVECLNKIKDYIITMKTTFEFKFYLYQALNSMNTQKNES